MKRKILEKMEKSEIDTYFCGESCTGGGELTLSCDKPAHFRALNGLLQPVILQCRSLNRDDYFLNYLYVYIESRNYKQLQPFRICSD